MEDYVEFERSTLLDPDAPYSARPDEGEYGELGVSVYDEDVGYWIDTNEWP